MSIYSFSKSLFSKYIVKHRICVCMSLLCGTAPSPSVSPIRESYRWRFIFITCFSTSVSIRKSIFNTQCFANSKVHTKPYFILGFACGSVRLYKKLNMAPTAQDRKRYHCTRNRSTQRAYHSSCHHPSTFFVPIKLWGNT